MAKLGSSGGGSTGVSKSEFRQLQREVNLLENGLAGPSLSSASADNLWSADEIYQFAKKSVVEIKVLKTTRGFFGQKTEKGLGSGFVYDASGHIVTNQHVVEGVEEILVRFHNGETVRAEVVGSDPYSDLAVLKVNPTGLDTELVPLELGNSSSLETGDRVVAVGNPFGLEGTTTFGIVSQTGRVLSSGTRYLIPGVIQIDAPINPGNSGGPLFNMRGEVIGITSAIRSGTGEFSGIGYAIPSDLVKRVVPSLIENGEYEYPWLGISGKKVSYQIAQERGLERTRGFLVKSVEEKGPSIGKLKKNDIILEIGGREVMGAGDILFYLALEKSPRENVSLKILRGGDRKTVTVELGTRPLAQ
ncbi:hypothetical protein AKJ37_00550 [candidate division MSBL1 archaeon SCGC-AAA259I09]|uniref:PDZ domain-containing protein n=1 Tax=candidate division MSBL1 archaeon SCGC-AAA259I09 TaxID=1698267 RepID=A0A133UW28_9EURY|nr:hypothetical protein AKJ37_00550 [candidate division MSBL1 archaeon SCGC-AAA259I09]